jgi:hypothetical protein
MYIDWFLNSDRVIVLNTEQKSYSYDPAWCRRNLHSHKGKDLASYCSHQHRCHADFLLEKANEQPNQ